VIQFNISNAAALQPLLIKLVVGLREEHLAAVSVGRLMRDADPTD
jgi:hypothetical protein